jgi:hypothetical protein
MQQRKRPTLRVVTNDTPIAPAASLSKGINALSAKNALSPATPKQGVLDLDVEVERVVSGVEMGVLENGLPYLTQRGLAEMSGV